MWSVDLEDISEGFVNLNLTNSNNVHHGIFFPIWLSGAYGI